MALVSGVLFNRCEPVTKVLLHQVSGMSRTGLSLDVATIADR